jgi:hypothetical protein
MYVVGPTLMISLGIGEHIENSSMAQFKLTILNLGFETDLAFLSLWVY